MLTNTATEADGALRRPDGIYSGLLGGGGGGSQLLFRQQKENIPRVHTHTLAHTPHTQQCKILHFLTWLETAF